jgi:xylulokinase
LDAVRTGLLPKDYVRYRLTGALSTDLTDASGTLAFDTRRAAWSDELIQSLELSRSIFPAVHLPEDPAGVVSKAAGQETGLAVGTPVFHGGADQVMQAIGNGILKAGQISVTIGTGGQVFAPLSGFSYDPLLRSHTFNHVARDRWYFLGAALSAGLSLRWLRDQVLGGMEYSAMDRLAGIVAPGSDGLVFLPYLSGERTPHMDPEARGLFFGLTLRHGQGHLARAVMEGVVFALRDCLEVYRGLGQPAEHVIASGGGARSPFWLQLQADILKAEVRTSRMAEQAGVGAAITAGVGAGIYTGYDEACSQVVRWSDAVYSPDQAAVQKYEDYFKLYQELYMANRALMHRCTRLARPE